MVGSVSSFGPTLFVAGERGQWRIDETRPVRGETLSASKRIEVLEPGQILNSCPADWTLRGTASNSRYASRRELDLLSDRQPAFERPEAKRAVLIPIRKSSAWWALAQDERRSIMEEQSHHIRIGMDYLPAIARRLYQSRDLAEPFDFVTWFEFAPVHEPAFDKLVDQLRATKEWRYVEREVEIRLTRDEIAP